LVHKNANTVKKHTTHASNKPLAVFTQSNHLYRHTAPPPRSSPRPSVQVARDTNAAAGAGEPSNSNSGSSPSTSASIAAASAPPQQQQPQPQQQRTVALGVSGTYRTTASSLGSLSSLSSLSSLGSLDGDVAAAALDLRGELSAAPLHYRLSERQAATLGGLSSAMRGCSVAFIAVAAAGVTLTLAGAMGHAEEAGAELGSVTVGDVANWVDSLLVAALLRYGASAFSAAAETPDAARQLPYAFRGIGRLGVMFNQFAIAAGTVSVVTTLEAASEWPPLVTLASGLFFAAAVARSGAMWCGRFCACVCSSSRSSFLWGL
jgi:hypothetical protein